MSLNVKVNRKFTINGKEYNSIEEMPDDVRETFKKAMGLMASAGSQGNPAVLQKKFSFNLSLGGKETVTVPPVIDLPEHSNDTTKEPGFLEKAQLDHISQATKPGTSFSSRIAIASVVLGGLLLLIYYLWNGK